MSTKEHKILNTLEDYDYTFDKVTIFDLEFSREEQVEFLKKLGYEIKQVTYVEETIETDEFYGGKKLKREIVAVKPGEKITHKGDYYPQLVYYVFKKEIKNKMKDFITK